MTAHKSEWTNGSRAASDVRKISQAPDSEAQPHMGCEREAQVLHAARHLHSPYRYDRVHSFSRILSNVRSVVMK
jgi:hypothetical protein